MCLGFAIFASQDIFAQTLTVPGCGQILNTGTDAPADHLVLQVGDRQVGGTCNRLLIEDNVDYTEIPFYSAWENVTWQDHPTQSPTDTAYVEAFNPPQASWVMTVRTLTVNDVFLDTETNRFAFKGNPISIAVNDGGSISLARNPGMLASQNLTIGTASGSGLIRDFGGNQNPSTTFSVAAGATLQLLDSGALPPGAPATSRLNFTALDNGADIQGTLDIHRSHVILPTTGTSVSAGTEMLAHNGGQLLVSGSNGTVLDTGKIRVEGGSLQAATGNNTVDVDYLVLNDAQVSLGDNAQIHTFVTVVAGNTTITLGDNPGDNIGSFVTQLTADILGVEGPLVLEGFAKLITPLVTLTSSGHARITESATLEIIPGVDNAWGVGSVEIGPDAKLSITSGVSVGSRVPIQNDGSIIVAGTFQPSGVMSGNGFMRIQSLGKLGPLGVGAATTLTASPDIFMDPLSTFEVAINPTQGSAQQLIANSIFSLNPLGTVLKLTIDGDVVLPHGTKFVVVDYPDGNNLFGHFTRQDRSLLYEGDLITAGLNTYMLSYADLDEGGSAITLTVQPHVAADSATFKVSKAYSDGNTAPVDVTLTCNGGLPLEQSFTISPGNPVYFTLTNFESGTVTCEVTESGSPEGYVPSFMTNLGATSATSCVFDTVETNHNYACGITNTASNGTYTVNKQWIVDDDFDDSVAMLADVTILCDSEILENDAQQGNGEWYVIRQLVGETDSTTVEVDTSGGTAECRASEHSQATGIEVDNGCTTTEISLGEDASCTITNTVFFEGIPALDRYGLALLALLMLGMGVVGVRRFT